MAMEGPSELKGIKYPAKAHSLNVKRHFLSKKKDAINSAFFVSGTSLEFFAYCDETIPLRQNRYFHYLSGINQIPGCYILYTLADQKLTLYLPEIDYDDVMWSGMPISLKEAKEKFDVDVVEYESAIESKLTQLVADRIVIYTTDTENYAKKPFSKLVRAGDKDFFYALDESRLIKDSYEISMMKYANKITANSHVAVMAAQPIEQNETHMHAEFIYHSIRQGSKFQSYDPICCSGPNCGTLHYMKNDDTMVKKCSTLIDAGADWECYASDVTRCFPISGEWTKEHMDIYETVQDMQKQVLDGIKPGVSWDHLHLLAHKVMIKHFLNLGLFINGTEEEIFDSKVSVWFFPHGLGHLIGLDTHDVGGYPNYDDPDIRLRWLRLRRKLLPGMVVTDEPGVYFNDYLLENAYKEPKMAKYIDKDVVRKYMNVGGVRIEDDILVTKNGHENLTVVTSDPEEISKIVKKGIAKGKKGFHVVV
ncbi:hypothetical protein FOA43_000687 [Brettanomyces nanus]|uniref:Aminopeptidase P N-terminal domain-containing protein n=1 Tax=Eeniella nana TaxID=13502 RepID=A0A875RTD4_EENNA|nr:uncharacterized protein FOA43_000687 [Brettanomyces nanus]QPG73377.1 hypothetical protein FOA43_000687 [Brettanomyces nanus]